MKSPVEVSVIVPCHNPGLHLTSLLESLAKQTFAGSWEVILVDNRSTEDISTFASPFQDRVNLRIVEARKKRNASYARNVGVRAAEGDKFLFVDADDQVASGYVAAMAAALDSHEFVTSRVDSETLNPEWAIGAQKPWQEEGVEMCFDFLPATGINVGIRRTLFELLEEFPEEYSGSQDIAFSWTVQLKTKRPIHFVPEAVYLYRLRQELRGIYRQSCNWGYSHVLLYRQFRKFGMPGKPLKYGLADWKIAIGSILKARTREELIPVLARLGYCVGRLKGSIRYRTLYL